MDTLKIDVESESSLEKLTDQVQHFDKGKVSTTQSSVFLSRREEKEALLTISRPQNRHIKDISLTVDITLDNIRSQCLGCCILTDGRMVFTNSDCKVVRIINTNGTEADCIKTPNSPYDVTQVNDTTLAVSCPFSGIQLIDIERRQVTNTLLTGHSVHGITFRDDDHLIYCEIGVGVRMINIKDGAVTCIVDESLPWYCYVTSFGDFVIHTNWKTNTVTCHDINGEKKWSFTDESVLRRPHGISTDKNGNVYVMGRGSGNVVIISADGQKNREIKCELNDMYSLDYDKVKDKLLVANLKRKAVLMKQNL